jgi:hypothetical protein
MVTIKGKALRRALSTNDAIRLAGDVPLIVDKTEFITPQIAQEMLKLNKHNRPINWKKVEEYSRAMSAGEWKLHSQGIILDAKGNILTGQKRLWAVVYSGTSVYMRVSRGCPADTVRLIDRGTPQTGRDLAARETERKHSATEASIARGVAFLRGHKIITPDVIADIMIEKEKSFQVILGETKGTKKTKAVLMILSAIAYMVGEPLAIKSLSNRVEGMAAILEKRLLPSTADKCWGRGVAFILALEQAKKCVEEVTTGAKI